MNDEFTVTIPVRYRDLDPMGHVNNAVYASYLEQVRTTYIDEVVERDDETAAFVIANLEITYRKSIEYGDEAVVSMQIVETGTTSCTMDHEIRVDGEVVATAEATLVHVDPASQEPVPLEGTVRERLRAGDGLESTTYSNN